MKYCVINHKGKDYLVLAFFDYNYDYYKLAVIDREGNVIKGNYDNKFVIPYDFCYHHGSTSFHYTIKDCFNLLGMQTLQEFVLGSEDYECIDDWYDKLVGPAKFNKIGKYKTRAGAIVNIYEINNSKSRPLIGTFDDDPYRPTEWYANGRFYDEKYDSSENLEEYLGDITNETILKRLKRL